MSTRISVVLCSVLFIVVSMLVVHSLLFAQEGGEVCTPGIFDPGDPQKSGPVVNGLKRVTTIIQISVQYDDTCVPHHCPQPPCSTKPTGYPKMTTKTTTFTEAYTGGQWLPESTDTKETYKLFYDEC